MTTPDHVATPVRIRPAERADLLDVLRIERQSFPQPWPISAFERHLGSPAFYVAEVDLEAVAATTPEVVGYVVADRIPNHGRDFGHVKDLAVRANRRGEGIATRLLERALSTLAAEGARTVKLEVRRGNEEARALYERFGFEYLKTAPRYYDDGEDALILVCDLTGTDAVGPADATDRTDASEHR